MLTVPAAFYRYLDLTPAMEVLPRGPLTAEVAMGMRCHEVSFSEDTLKLRDWDNGEPSAVFGLSREITVVSTDSLVEWNLGDFVYRISLDSLSRPLLLVRMTPNGEVIPGEEGSAFTRWYWQPDGRVTVVALDSEGVPIAVKLEPTTGAVAARLDDSGELEYFTFGSVAAYGLRYQLDGNGRMLLKEAVDRSGSVVVSSNGVASANYRYDRLGNRVSTIYRNLQGEVVPGDYLLPVSGNWEFDETGVVRNGAVIAYVEREFDGNCLYVVERNMGADGFPVEDDLGRAVTLYDREAHGGISGCRWFGADGNPVEVAGIWATERSFDRYGRVLESRTLNSLGEPAEFAGGYAFTRFTYDERGLPTMISYYDRAGAPVINSTIGCHARIYYYDDSGEMSGARYLDTDYHLTDNVQGVARMIFLKGSKIGISFDSRGNPVEEVTSPL